MKTLARFLLQGLAVFATAWLLPGVTVDNYWAALIVAIVLALLNMIVKPVLVFLTIPATVFSLGLFLFVINACMILLADWLVEGFHVAGFWWALLFSIILSLINSVLEKIMEGHERKRHGRR